MLQRCDGLLRGFDPEIAGPSWAEICSMRRFFALRHRDHEVYAPRPAQSSRANLHSSVITNTMRTALRHRSAAFGALAFLGGALGLWVSFRYTFAAWQPDPDIFVTVALWRGVHRYGLPFLQSWWYTQDNWLLSVIPISSLAFELFGPRPNLAVLLGWLAFVVSVMLTAWLAYRIAGGRCAVILDCVLMFGRFSALGRTGYLAYPISHNMSMAWGLIVLVFAFTAWSVATSSTVLRRPWRS
jgi:hypothetical protein